MADHEGTNVEPEKEPAVDAGARKVENDDTAHSIDPATEAATNAELRDELESIRAIGEDR